MTRTPKMTIEKEERGSRSLEQRDSGGDGGDRGEGGRAPRHRPVGQGLQLPPSSETVHSGQRQTPRLLH